MLASLGQIFQYYWRLPDEVFNQVRDNNNAFTSSHLTNAHYYQGDKPFKALEQIFHERPLAAVQIILAIFAVEALGQFNQVKPGQAPGDLGWDPLGLKPSDPEVWESVQLRELKNGRLAMLASAGMLYTELLSGEREVSLPPGSYSNHTTLFYR
jgi:hypothetical protein